MNMKSNVGFVQPCCIQRNAPRAESTDFQQQVLPSVHRATLPTHVAKTMRAACKLAPLMGPQGRKQNMKKHIGAAKKGEIEVMPQKMLENA